MTENEFIERFINNREIESNRYSCLVIALHDARLLNGRERETGKHKNIILTSENDFYDPNSFLGLIGYLILLDMIGGLFVKVGFHSKKSSIYKTLKQFSNFKDDEIDVIISLRNSLAHNYSLVNIPISDKENKSKLHKFELIFTQTNFIISIPSESNRWNKDFSNKNEMSSTKINVRALIDEFEDVYQTLKTEVNNGNVSLLKEISLEELKSRFTIRH